MEFGNPKSKLASKQIGVDQFGEHNLNLYLEPPSEEITLLECEDLVVERLKLLQIVERLKNGHRFMSKPFQDAFDKEVQKLQPLYTITHGKDKASQFRRRDVISHFLLRLACSMSVDLTQRFISRELDLFRIRFETEKGKIRQFLEDSKIKLDVVSKEELAEFRWKLINGNRIKEENIDATEFYKLRFTDCLVLVRSRKVFLHAGYCYVTVNDLIQFLTQKFRLILSNSMNKQRTQMSQLDEDDRLLPLLQRLVYEGTQSNEQVNLSGRVIRPEQVDELSNVSFPLCMRTIHNRLRSDHHVKFFARQQYGLFLKGAGLPLEGSIAFFRQEFTKKMDIDKFDKTYLYNIRHMFGKEGNRVDHKPQSCPSIILNNPPGQSDCHGCPFRHADPKALEHRLQLLQISKDRAEKIVQMASKERRYDLACTRVLEYTHGMNEGDCRVVTSPNQYFDMSRDIREGKR